MFHYYGQPGEFLDTGGPAHVAVVPAGIKAMRALMTELGELLAFPRYYGKNLDAFWDCVTELEDVKQRRVVVAHQDLPELPGEGLQAYIALMRDSTLFWNKPDAAHSFEAWFPKSVQTEVEAILKVCEPPAGD